VQRNSITLAQSSVVPPPAQSNSTGVVVAFGLTQLSERHRGLDVTRRDRINRNPVLANLLGEIHRGGELPIASGAMAGPALMPDVKLFQHENVPPSLCQRSTRSRSHHADPDDDYVNCLQRWLERFRSALPVALRDAHSYAPSGELHLILTTKHGAVQAQVSRWRAI
jgi:hypothetical protein